MGCQLNTRSRGRQCTTSPPSHYGCVPQSSQEEGSPVSRTLCDVWEGLKKGEQGRVNRQRKESEVVTVWFLTLEKVHGLTNQNQQFSALHDNREEDSQAWCHDELLSSHGNTLVHQISPPCTRILKRLALGYNFTIFAVQSKEFFVTTILVEFLPWQYADHQICHISEALCTFHHVGRTQALKTPSYGHGSNCRSAGCLDAWGNEAEEI